MGAQLGTLSTTPAKIVANPRYLMDQLQQVWIYVGIAALTLIVTLLFLVLTRVAAVVTIGTALVVAAIVVFVARLELGFWDPLAPVAFVANAAFAFAVSFAVLAIGRWLRWTFFMPRRHETKVHNAQ